MNATPKVDPIAYARGFEDARNGLPDSTGDKFDLDARSYRDGRREYRARAFFATGTTAPGWTGKLDDPPPAAKAEIKPQAPPPEPEITLAAPVSPEKPKPAQFDLFL